MKKFISYFTLFFFLLITYSHGMQLLEKSAYKIGRTFFKQVPSFYFSKGDNEDKQVFLRATQDAIAKHLFEDEEIRNSFIRALTPFDNVVKSTMLDNALRPLGMDENLLNTIKTEEFKKFITDKAYE
ncbi:MAG: hypothetical protein ACTSXG_02715, partial [Alphaproteobacteria bacterium]